MGSNGKPRLDQQDSWSGAHMNPLLDQDAQEPVYSKDLPGKEPEPPEHMSILNGLTPPVSEPEPPPKDPPAPESAPGMQTPPPARPPAALSPAPPPAALPQASPTPVPVAVPT